MISSNATTFGQNMLKLLQLNKSNAKCERRWTICMRTMRNAFHLMKIWPIAFEALWLSVFSHVRLPLIWLDLYWIWHTWLYIIAVITIPLDIFTVFFSLIRILIYCFWVDSVGPNTIQNARPDLDLSNYDPK